MIAAPDSAAADAPMEQPRNDQTAINYKLCLL